MQKIVAAETVHSEHMPGLTGPTGADEGAKGMTLGVAAAPVALPALTDAVVDVPVSGRGEAADTDTSGPEDVDFKVANNRSKDMSDGSTISG